MISQSDAVKWLNTDNLRPYHELTGN